MPVKPNIVSALKEAEKLININGIAAVGQGKNNGKDCVKVFTSLPIGEIKPKLPSKIQGFDVIVEFTGPVQALDSLQ